MEAARQRNLVRASVAARKQKEKEKGKEGASLSAPKVIGKGASKWKSKGKDYHPLKKGPVTPTGDKQLKKSSPTKQSHGAGKGLTTVTSLVTQGTSRHLFTHKGYVIEMVESIIKETNLDPCAEQEAEDLEASGLFDLSRAVVRMKALQDRCIVEEGVITRLRKRNETLTNEQTQYKVALRTLNEEVTAPNEKLMEEASLRGKAEEAKAIVEKGQTALVEQVETAKADAIAEFKASLPLLTHVRSTMVTGLSTS